MAAIEVGRICAKNRGRESGKRCVVVDLIDENFALVSGPQSLTGIRRRRANIRHLTPTGEKIDIQAGADDSMIARILKDKPGYATVVAAPPKARRPRREETTAKQPPAPEPERKAKGRQRRAEAKPKAEKEEPSAKKPSRKRAKSKKKT